MSLTSLLRHSVTCKATTWAETNGVREVDTVTETTRAALVQPMSFARVEGYGIEQPAKGFTAYFASDPGMTTGDVITFDGEELQVLAPARDQGGQARVFAVDCTT